MMSEPNSAEAGRGWDSDFFTFEDANRSEMLQAISSFVTGASPQEQASWRSTIPHLQREVGEIIQFDIASGRYTAVLEYQMPMEARRVDAIFLMHDHIVVMELKGKSLPSEADIDQAHAYARDLRCYHRDCHNRQVIPILIPTRMEGNVQRHRHVVICPPDRLDGFLAAVNSRTAPQPVAPKQFLAADAYCPLPSLIQAARLLFNERRMPKLWQSLANTDEAVRRIESIVQEAARTRTRRLVLLTGVPGAGKTLVGLRLVHAEFLDDLSRIGTPAPAIFLSGNGPLVEVLQYELRGQGGSGKAFVRHVKDYMRTHMNSRKPRLQHHVMVFDEAQRAFDVEMVAEKHHISVHQARSEPHSFIEFAERVPDWAVVVGLIGTGQEIHKGEEAGLGQWAQAIRESPRAAEWHIHGPAELDGTFAGQPFTPDADLALTTSLRSHLARHLDIYVDQIVIGTEPKNERGLRTLADSLAQEGYDLRICRTLHAGKAYLRERYAEQPDKRYGMIMSSRDKTLQKLDWANRFTQWPFNQKRGRTGPWYADDEMAPGSQSCRHLKISITEFEAQGLELDGVLLGWGTDFLRQGGQWNTSRMKKYHLRRNGAIIRNAFQLRINCYRVLLTRARDVTVVYVPERPEYAETAAFLTRVGFRPLDRH